MIQPISNFYFREARSPASADLAGAPSQVQQPEPVSPVRSPVPAVDRYIPEEKQPSSGRYCPGGDPDGPRRESPGKKPERCTCDTGKVDREIKQLKRRQAELERRLGTQTDDAGARELERQLSQVERELRQKDNDAYRRQHAEFS